jgi:ubiquinone/menaquinone biosynthesis C-methylase UbiE
MRLMTEDRRRVAADFDVRSTGYSKNQWHRVYADGLISNSAIRFGDRVLDAGVGTAFAAIAAAARVGPEGRVVGVDVSPGMLQQAQLAVEAAGLGNIELLEADACQLPDLADESFDAVVCSAALLYMPVQRALMEWHRL